MQSVASRLKLLREQSGLSVRKLAALIEMDFSRYAYFEDARRFKKPRLELGFARQLARVLGDHGIAPSDVMALAGLEKHEVAPPLSAAEEEWAGLFDKLTAKQRKLLLQMARELVAPDEDDDPAPGGTVHHPQHAHGSQERRQ